MMKEVRKALKPVKNRIRRNRFLTGAAAGLAAGLGAAALLQAASFFVPVPDRGLWGAAAAAAVTLLTALGNALRPVKNREAAEAADACGLQERAITALEGGDEPIRALQRRDACSALKALDVKQIRPGSARKALFAALGSAALLACLLLAPNPMDSEAAAGKALARTLSEGREKIAQAAEEDGKELTEEEKSELRKITGDLERKLAESRDAADALVALDRAEQRLEQFRQQTSGEAAAGQTGTEAGAADSGGNTEQGSEAEASSGTESAQQNAATAGTGLTASQMKTLQALAALKNAVNPSAMQGTGAQALAGMQGGMNGGNSGGTSGSGGQNPDGKTGGGAGEGTTNREETGSGQHNGTLSLGNRDPRYKETEYETIYDPEHIDKARQDVMTEQDRLNDEDATQIETGPGRGNLNGDVPWNDALRDYADTEARAADRENLTEQERKWIDEYYRLLTEQQ